jgi:multicomponent Na+:H+ antiporter subunit B
MGTLIFSTAARYLLPLLLLFSIFVFARGHNEPGGGFVGGLVAAAAFALYSMAYTPAQARKLLWVEPRLLIGLGLMIALASGLLSLAGGLPFMTGIWSSFYLPVIGAPGSPILFDLGVYLAVIGVILTILFALAEDTE